MESIELLRILDEFKKIHAELEELKKNQVIPKLKTQSDQINELAAALAKAQAEMRIAGKSKENPYFKSKYADWESVVSASRPALTKNGLSVVIDKITEDDGQTYINCSLLHTSGQFMKSRVRFVPPKPDIQSISSYNTSLKRLLYCNLVGVVVGDEDDDGEYAVATEREVFAKGTALNTKYNPLEQGPEVINRTELEHLEHALVGYPDLCEKVLSSLKINSLADMPKAKYRASLDRIMDVKKAENQKSMLKSNE